MKVALSGKPALSGFRLRCLSALAFLIQACWMAAAAPTASLKAAVFSEDLPGFNPTLASDISAQVQAAGYTTVAITAAVLTNQALLTPNRYDLLVLPGARSLPMAAAPAVESYLQGGGDLLALGLPAWEAALFRVNGRWISRARYEQSIASQRPHHIVEDFEHADLSRWTRASGDASGKASYELATAAHGKALHVVIAHLAGWETLASPTLSHPFPIRHTLTCFRAKGGPHTRQLAVEWVEEDGSRWIATVDLTPQWKDYSLAPEAFKPWPVWPSGHASGRNFEPQKAARVCVGLALSHTALEGDKHEYWFDDLGTAPNPFGEVSLPVHPQVLRLESLSPGYQCFPIASPVQVRADQEKVALEPWESGSGVRPLAFKDGQDFLSGEGLQPRPRGVGFNQDRPFRWEPLLGAYDPRDGDYRGALAALLVHLEPPFRGGVWAVFTPDNPRFYRQPVVTNCLRQVLARMKRGVFLAEGGSEFFTVFAGQQFKVGARVVNFGHTAVSNLTVAVTSLDAKRAVQRTLVENRFVLGPGQVKAVEQDGLAKSADEEAIATDLTLGSSRIDGLTHEFGVWEPKTQPEFIEARDGGFWWRGKPWKANGVNYMPSSGIGVGSSQFFEHWLGRGAYDPEVIERDLGRIKAMNLNAVSVFIYHESLKAQNLLDFLRRCDRLELRVNLSLRPGTPMDFRWNEMRELVEYYRLAQNDSVFAYDLAWEPSHGDHAHQQRAYAALWNDWVLKRYGSAAAAEAAWGIPAPSDDPAPHSPLPTPHLSVPPISQLTRDGPWRRLAADYRLFLDHLLRERYSAARTLMKSIDPHHAVSFRMSCAGDPSYNWDAALPYDFYGLAQAVDIWEPEAYGRIGDWDHVKPGEFTAAYARLCDAAKPLVWAEMGYNAWDINRMAPDPEKLKFEERYYTDFYRMMIESGADGVFFWWYPGGFRLGENSDFGIINPDGTDRPATKVIRSDGRRFLRASKPKPPDFWIAVDRDRDARGLFGMYEAAKDEFWTAISKGQRPGLKWQHKPGTRPAP